MNFTNLMKQTKIHALTFLRGIGRTFYGAFITGLIATSIYGFWLIGNEEGYAAVFDFIASCAVLVVAICNVYLLGNKRKGAKK